MWRFDRLRLEVNEFTDRELPEALQVVDLFGRINVRVEGTKALPRQAKVVKASNRIVA